MNPQKTIRILLLEDDLETVSLLTEKLAEIERQIQERGQDLSLVVLSEYTMVEQYINTANNHKYDVVLLDRDCKAGGSFHVLDYDKFDKDRIISISSVPDWNDEAQIDGINKVVCKDFEYLGDFIENVGDEIRGILELPQQEETLDTDPLLPEAIHLTKAAGIASTTSLQSKLRIGYARAAHLLDLMEEAGVIGPAEGSESRKVLK